MCFFAHTQALKISLAGIDFTQTQCKRGAQRICIMLKVSNVGAASHNNIQRTGCAL